jgi:hypothetical protein
VGNNCLLKECSGLVVIKSSRGGDERLIDSRFGRMCLVGASTVGDSRKLQTEVVVDSSCVGCWLVGCSAGGAVDT